MVEETEVFDPATKAQLALNCEYVADHTKTVLFFFFFALDDKERIPYHLCLPVKLCARFSTK